MNTPQKQEYKYKAVRIKQTESGDWLVLFAASAVEIDIWAGIPQKKKIGTQETTGFQREESKKRIKEIGEFYSNEQNIIQNPLLCALRQPNQHQITFQVADAEQSSNDFIQHGFLCVNPDNIESLSLLELLKRVKFDLEQRVPELAESKVSDQMIREIKEHAELHPQSASNIDEEEQEDIPETENNLGISFSDESHIFDFWQEVAAYVAVLEELGDSFSADQFLDYSKEAMISFLRPVVVVDGQHRLQAAIQAAQQLAEQERYQQRIEELIFKDDLSADLAQQKVEAEAARKLPVSLLMNNDPAEHVFQFVVVNQKATPIKPALLGTIVSTSLSNEELERVSDRLENAGIKLEESRAVTFMIRHPASPFYNLVERGLASDTKDRLKWNVLASVIKIFRDLKGGKLFHETIDYADKWKRYYLDSSDIVDEWQDQGFESPYEYWRDLNGCWRDVFIAFWTTVRDKLADKNNDQSWHYWGDPKQSNIFNKTSLTILAADFFQYLCERRIEIKNAEQIPPLVDDWLRDVNRDYFNRDWNLHGVKKDVPGIRKQWSMQWLMYRKDPIRLPNANLYRKPMN